MNWFCLWVKPDEVDFFCPSFVRAEVLAFVRSGWIGPAHATVTGVGEGGYGRSRTAVSATFAGTVFILPTDVTPSSDSSRFDGLPLRWEVAGSVPILGNSPLYLTGSLIDLVVTHSIA